MSFGASPEGRQEGVNGGSGSEIDNFLTRIRSAPKERIAHAGKGFAGVIGKLVKRRRRVAESNRVGAPGMEVILSGGVLCDLAVLLAHLLAERFQIDNLQYLSHRLLLVLARRMIWLDRRAQEHLPPVDRLLAIRVG